MTLSAQSAFTGFSCPQEGLAENLFETIVCEYASAVLDAFLGQFGAMIRTQATGLSDLLESAVSKPKSSNTVWCPALGDCFQAVQRHDPNAALSSAAALGLHLGANGISGNWEAKLAEPTTFLWNKWIVPECSHLSVENSGTSASLTAGFNGESKKIRLIYSAAWNAQGTESIPVIEGARRSLFVLPQKLLTSPKFDGLRTSAISEPGEKSVSPIEEALEGLKKNLPAYYDWVTRIVGQIFIMEAPDRLVSGSIQGQLGLLYISNTSDQLAIAEMLIHEASHQYYYLLSRLGAMDDGSDHKLYLNPFINALRPLARIVLGYHAFANVWMFYKTSIDVGFGQVDRCAHQMDTIMKRLENMQDIVDGNAALTPIGKALVEPLLVLTSCKNSKNMESLAAS